MKMTETNDQSASIKKWIITELILLFAEFQMGMSVNLFLVIPLDSPLDILLQVTSLELILHIVILDLTN